MAGSHAPLSISYPLDCDTINLWKAGHGKQNSGSSTGDEPHVNRNSVNSISCCNLNLK